MLLSTILAALGVLSCTSAARVSTDGSCGNVRGKQLTCLKSSFGSCCSQHGWCGSSPAYCAAGCKSAFGSCNGASPSSMLQSTTRSSVRISGTPPPQPLAKNGRCGPDSGGRTCLGSEWGNCCSQYSYCGSTPDYCAPRSCQTGFGLCDASSSSSSSARATTSMSAHALSVASASSSTAVSASTPSVVSSLSLAAAVSSTPLVTSTSSTSDTSVSSRTSISDIIASSSSQAIPMSPTRSTIPSPSAICTSQILTNGDFESGSLSPFASYCPVQNNCGGFSVEPETGNTANHVYQFTSREYGCGGHLRQTVNLPSTQVTISCSFRYRVVSGTSPNLQIYAQIGSQYCTGSAGSYVGVTADWTTISGTLGPIQGSPNTAYLWVNFGSDDRPGPVLQMDDFVVTYCYQPS